MIICNILFKYQMCNNRYYFDNYFLSEKCFQSFWKTFIDDFWKNRGMGMILEKSCYKKFRKIHWKTPDMDRSSHIKCSIEKSVLKKVFFIKKETPTQVLSCEICEIFRNLFLQNTPGELLLNGLLYLVMLQALNCSFAKNRATIFSR